MVAVVAAMAPAAAGAYATPAPPTRYSASTGLPDGRVYEQLSPTDKGGSQAGGQFTPLYGEAASKPANARADGNALLFWGNGPMGDSVSGLDDYFIAERGAGEAGWSTRSALSRGSVEDAPQLLVDEPKWIEPSADFSHTLSTGQAAYAPPPDSRCDSNIEITGPDPSIGATWIGQPMIENPFTSCEELVAVGGTPDLSTSYFTAEEALLPADGARLAHMTEKRFPWGFYEYRNGALGEAGVLPDGSVDPYGAVPAGFAGVEINRLGFLPEQINNQVSADGSRAFFVSPEPQFCIAHGCGGETPQLYVREAVAGGSPSTELVSQSQLPGHVGKPAATGPVPLTAALRFGTGPNEAPVPSEPFVYATPDGSHAFFASASQLTGDAPADGGVYDFNTVTRSLTYLPGVPKSIVMVADDGSWVLTENASSDPEELDLWKNKGASWMMVPIVQLPDVSSTSSTLGPVRVSENGSVIVFESNIPIEGSNAGSFRQIYRYELGSQQISCVSCPPAGISPSGNTVLSNNDAVFSGATGNGKAVVPSRGISSDGSRVFFETSDPLVAQDIDGVRDVYEWEDGSVFLISGGTSPVASLILDNGADGRDVFFATAQSLQAGDTDAGYDVYDARIPHPGDDPPVAAVPCQGSVCQGPPRVPVPLGAPASATFSGLGNIAPQISAVAKPSSKLKKSSRKTKKKHAKAMKKAKRSPRRPKKGSK